MLVGHEVPVIVLSYGSLSCCALPSGGFLDRFPAVTGTTAQSATLLAIVPRFVAFAWHYRFVRLFFVPHGHQARRPWAWSWFWPLPLAAYSTRSQQGFPGSLGDPCACAPRSLIPVGQLALAMSGTPVLPPLLPRASATTMIAFEIQSRSSHARCLRFVARVTPPPRKTRYRPAGWALGGQDFHLLGLIAGFQGCIVALLSYRPRLSWRTGDRVLCIGRVSLDKRWEV